MTPHESDTTMAMFFIKDTEPTDAPPQMPDGSYKGVIAKIEEETYKNKQGVEGLRCRFTVKPHPTSGVTGSGRILLPYPKDADDWTNNEWAKIFMAALGKDAKSVSALMSKSGDVPFAKIKSLIEGKPTYFSHRNDAREYEAKDKDGNVVMRKSSDTRFITAATYTEYAEGTPSNSDTISSKSGGGAKAAAQADDDLFA